MLFYVAFVAGETRESRLVSSANHGASLKPSKNQNSPLPHKSKKNTLVLQWEVSHPRNTDQISLIFRPTKVELVTNVSFYKKGQKVRLGRFQSPLTPNWQAIKKRVSRYQRELKKTVPLSTLIKDDRVKPHHKPHAPILRLDAEVIHEGSAYFKELTTIIHEVLNHQWSCVECAEYQRQKKAIIRTIKKQVNKNQNLPNTANKQKGPTKSSPKWKTHKKTFTLKELNCVSKGQGKVECVDQAFGVFEI